jgi:hypothetical protein
VAKWNDDYICPNCHGTNGMHSGMDQCPPTPPGLREKRRWFRSAVRPHKTYSELNPAALEAAINVAERIHKDRIRPPAISAAIQEYLRVR